MQPADFGLPAKFGTWRPHQFEALLDLEATSTRFVGTVAPVGAGKTGIYMALALSNPGRTAILVSTKGLQDQGTMDFRGLTTDIRGQANYPCEWEKPRKVGCDRGPCHIGVKCDLKAKGCLYYDQVRRAIKARVVWTNYAYWMSANAYGEGLGEFDRLILDEAHAAYDHLSDFVSIFISDVMVDAYLQGKKPPLSPSDWSEWARVGVFHVKPRKLVLDLAVQDGDRSAYQEAREVARLLRNLEDLATVDGSRWIMAAKEDGAGWTWQPIWSGRYAEQHLFRGIPKVILTSATIREKTLDMLHIPKDSRTMFEYPSSFPKTRRPIYVVPSVRVGFKTTPAEMRIWVDRVDQIIGPRQHWKGLIHTGSYKRMKYLLEHSKYAGVMMTHARRGTADAVQSFKRAKAPAVLVSPALSTGWDFPGDECRYQIIGKVPFPDMMNPLVVAREKEDKQYASYLAMVDIVQASGRGMRSEKDFCETFVIDNHFGDWFLRRNKQYAPKWFLEAIQVLKSVPRPATGV